MLAVSRTNRGLVRENNEDSVLVRVPNLFAIADGMGGYNAGEIASFETVRLLSDLDCSQIPESEVLSYMERKIKKINTQIWTMSQEIPEQRGMGTTLTAVYLGKDGVAFVGHVGDSRIYLMQDGVFKQVTSDHSLVAEMVRQKQLTPSEAATSSQKHVITRAIGAFPEVEVDLFEFIVTGAQKLLLCSDGLSDMVPNEAIEHLLLEEDLNVIADKLMELALAAGGKDNISFIILDLEG